MATTITETWLGAREVFGEILTKDTLITKANSWNDNEDIGSQNILTPTKKLCFKEVKSKLKLPKHSKKKERESWKAYFEPRFNVKLTKKIGIFRNMAFRLYLQLSLPITIQQVNEYGATKKNTGSNY